MPRVLSRANQINRRRRRWLSGGDGINGAADLVPCEQPNCVALTLGGGVCRRHQLPLQPARKRRGGDHRNTRVPLLEEIERRELASRLLDVLNAHGRSESWKLVKRIAADEGH